MIRLSSKSVVFFASYNCKNLDLRAVFSKLDMLTYQFYLLSKPNSPVVQYAYCFSFIVSAKIAVFFSFRKFFAKTNYFSSFVFIVNVNKYKHCAMLYFYRSIKCIFVLERNSVRFQGCFSFFFLYTFKLNYFYF